MTKPKNPSKRQKITDVAPDDLSVLHILTIVDLLKYVHMADLPALEMTCKTFHTTLARHPPEFWIEQLRLLRRERSGWVHPLPYALMPHVKKIFVSYATHSCISCGKKNKSGAHWNLCEAIRLCLKCKVPFKMISKAEVVRTYHIGRDGFKRLNPINRLNNSATLYLLEDVKRVALAHHGSTAKLEEAQKRATIRREKAREARVARKMLEPAHREKVLREALNQKLTDVGLELEIWPFPTFLNQGCLEYIYSTTATKKDMEYELVEEMRQRLLMLRSSVKMQADNGWDEKRFWRVWADTNYFAYGRIRQWAIWLDFLN
jgi:hypothetical protein